MSKPSFPVKTLNKFIELGVTGNIENVTVITIREILRVKTTTKGNSGDPLKCTIQLQDSTGTISMEVWKPEAELPFKLNDVISINEVESDWNDWNETWQIITCSRSEVTIHDPVRIPHIPDVVLGAYDTSQHKQPDIVIDMPKPPTPDRVVFPYFPGMTIFELRDYHMHEKVGAIRGHIENIIMMKELIEAIKK